MASADNLDIKANAKVVHVVDFDSFHRHVNRVADIHAGNRAVQQLLDATYSSQDWSQNITSWLLDHVADHVEDRKNGRDNTRGLISMKGEVVVKLGGITDHHTGWGDLSDWIAKSSSHSTS